MLDTKNWRMNPGASAEAVAKLVTLASFPLPESYLDFLSKNNGGEGPLTSTPDWLILYPVEEVTTMENEGKFTEFFPGHFVIGGNGGGEAVALAINHEGNEDVVYFDMTNTDLSESVVKLASSFEALLSLLQDRKD